MEQEGSQGKLSPGDVAFRRNGKTAMHPAGERLQNQLLGSSLSNRSQGNLHISSIGDGDTLTSPEPLACQPYLVYHFRLVNCRVTFCQQASGFSVAWHVKADHVEVLRKELGKDGIRNETKNSKQP